MLRVKVYGIVIEPIVRIAEERVQRIVVGDIPKERVTQHDKSRLALCGVCHAYVDILARRLARRYHKVKQFRQIVVRLTSIVIVRLPQLHRTYRCTADMLHIAHNGVKGIGCCNIAPVSTVLRHEVVRDAVANGKEPIEYVHIPDTILVKEPCIFSISPRPRCPSQRVSWRQVLRIEHILARKYGNKQRSTPFTQQFLQLRQAFCLHLELMPKLIGILCVSVHTALVVVFHEVALIKVAVSAHNDTLVH